MEGIKHFELSLWQDVLVDTADGRKFEEQKVCTIGSDKMESFIGAFDIKLVKKLNGDNQLSFSVYYNFIDPTTGKEVNNEITELLQNESKLKLRYGGEYTDNGWEGGDWYDFVIKSEKKDSNKRLCSYTAKDLHIQELSKNGYSLALLESQYNNVGTIEQLGNQVLEGTGWEVEAEELPEKIEDLLIRAEVKSELEAYREDNSNEITIPNNSIIYVYYGNLAEKQSRIQFIYCPNRQDGQEPKTVDGLFEDDAWISCYYDTTSSHYSNNKYHRFLDIKYPDFLGIIASPRKLRGKKIAWSIQKQYSPTLERYVDQFYLKSDRSKILGRDFTTQQDLPIINQNISTNGYNMSSTKGWSVPSVEGSSTDPTLSVAYRYNSLESATSYLVWKVRQQGGNEKPVLCNSGFYDNRLQLQNINKGEDWVFEIVSDATVTTEIQKIKPVIITTYGDGCRIEGTLANIEYDSRTGWTTSQWYLNLPDNWPEIPFNQFQANTLVQFQLEYQKESEENLSTSTPIINIKKLLMFKSMGYQTKDGGRKYYTPESISIKTENKLTYQFYKWNDIIGVNRKVTKSELQLYSEVDSTNAQVLDEYVPYYIKNKTRAVTIEKSNYFNALQSLCEAFKCWIVFDVGHDNNGKITTRKVWFKEYIDVPNYAGFKYGLNLSGISRDIKSDQIVTKLIVTPNNNQYAENGICTIQKAEANPTLETTIYNMDYFISRKMLSGSEWDNDCYSTDWGVITQYSDALSETIEDNLNNQVHADDGLEQAEELTNEILETEEDSSEMEDGIHILGYYPSVKYFNKRLTLFGNRINTNNGLLTIAKSKLEVAKIGLAESKKVLVDSIPQIIKTIPDSTGGAGWLIENSKQNIILTDDNTTEGWNLSNITNADYCNDGISLNGTITRNTAVHDSLEDQMVASISLEISKVSNSKKYSVGLLVRNDDKNTNYKTYFALGNNNSNAQLVETDQEWHFYSYAFESEPEGKNLSLGICLSNYEDYNNNEQAFIACSLMYPILLTQEDWDKYITPLMTDISYYEEQLEYWTNLVDKLQKRISKDQNIYNVLKTKKQTLLNTFYNKYKNFVKEGTWINDKISDPNLYYNEALGVSYNSAYPQVSYSINVLDISGFSQYQDFEYKVGDQTTVEDPDFFGWELDENLKPTTTPKKEVVIVSEVTYNLQNPSKNSIKTQTYKTQFNDLFNQITASVQSLTYAQGGFERAAEFVRMTKEEKGLFLIDALESAKSVINMRSDIQFTDDKGILVIDKDNSKNKIHLTGKGVAITNSDDGKYQTVISADGIIADTITSGILNVGKVRIMYGTEPTFLWDENGITAYDFDVINADNIIRIKNISKDKGVRFNRYGLFGSSGINNDLDKTLDDILNDENTRFALTWEGLQITNLPSAGETPIIGKVLIGKSGNSLINVQQIINGEPFTTFNIDKNGNVSIAGTVTITGGNIEHDVEYHYLASNTDVKTTIQAKSESLWKTDTSEFDPANAFGPVNRFLWQRRKSVIGSTPTVTYTLIGTYGQDGANGQNGQNGTSVTIDKTEYQITNGTNPIEANWDEDFPDNITPGSWLWTKVTYSDGNYVITKVYQGANGTNGTNGTDGINGTDGVSSYIHVAWANDTNGTDFSTSDSNGKSYFGCYTDTNETGSSDYRDYTWTLIKGADGATIDSIQYGISASGDTEPNPWRSDPPSITPGQWLWTKTTYSNGSYAITKTYQGVDGAAGANGTNGQDGASITATQQIYYAFTSSTTSPTSPNSFVTNTSSAAGSWTNTIPNLSGTAQYCYTCTQSRLSNGTVINSTIIRDTTIEQQYSFNKWQQAVANNSTITDGASIYTGAGYFGKLVVYKNNAAVNNGNHILFKADNDAHTVIMGGWQVDDYNIKALDNNPGHFIGGYIQSQDFPMAIDTWSVNGKDTSLIYQVGDNYYQYSGGNWQQTHTYEWSGSQLNLIDGTYTSKNLRWDKYGNLYCRNGYFEGEIHAVTGTFTGTIEAAVGNIGGWTIDSNSLYCGTLSQYGGAKISSADFEGTYAGQSFPDWRLAIGSNFGVTGDGTVYAIGVNLSGEINATKGFIGGLTISQENGLISDYLKISKNVLYFSTGQLNLNDQVYLYKSTNGPVYIETNGQEDFVMRNFCIKNGQKIPGAGIKFYKNQQNSTNTIQMSATVSLINYSAKDSGRWTNCSYNMRIDWTMNTAYPTISGIQAQVTVQWYEGQYVVATNTYTQSFNTTAYSLTGHFVFDSKTSHRSPAGARHATATVTLIYNNNTSNPITIASETIENNILYSLGHFAPDAQNMDLGTNNHPWRTIFTVNAQHSSGAWTSSDINTKTNISYLTTIQNNIFDKLQPVSYILKNGESGRTHYGLIAQDLKYAILTSGLTTQKCAIYADYTDNFNGATCGIRYEELIPLCIDQIQRLKARVAELEMLQGITYTYSDKGDYHSLGTTLEEQG